MSLLDRAPTRAEESRYVPQSQAFSRGFTVDVGYLDGEAVLVAQGELDLWTQPLFVAALARIRDGSARIVLDLSGVTLMDAGAIGLIYRARTLARAHGSDLVLRSPNPALLRILELTGLSDGGAARPIAPPLAARHAQPNDVMNDVTRGGYQPMWSRMKESLLVRARG